jgi:PAS domain S-box-containing protein/diguanylate cyclase (GGDEF)-like protein
MKEKQQIKIEKIKGSQKELQSYIYQILENSPDCIFSISPDGTIKYANSSFYNSLGYTPDEVIGKNIKEFIGDVSIYNQCMIDVKEKGKCLNQETVFKRKDGTKVKVIKNVNSIVDKNGNIKEIIVNARDLSYIEELNKLLEKDKEQVEKYAGKLEEVVIKKTRDLYKLKINLENITRNIPEAVIVLDKKGKIKFINESGEKLFGIKKEKLEDKYIFDYLKFKEIDKKELRKIIKQNKQTISVDLTFENKSSETPILLTIAPFVEEQIVSGSIIILKDISEIKEKEKELELKNLLLEKIKDDFPEGVLFVSTENKEKIIVNEKFLKMLNLDKKEKLTQKKIIKKIKEKLKYDSKFNISDLSRCDISQDNFEINFKDGRVFEVFSSYVLGKDNYCYGKVWFFKDITSHRKNEEILKEKLYIDSLTGLPNRQKLIEDVKNTPNPILAIINIDSFNEVNDFYGHKVGDFILKEMAKKLEKFVSKYSFNLYKLSSDEYGVLVNRFIPKQEFEMFLAKLSSEINEEPIIYNGSEIHLTITIGAALEKEDIFSKADIALKLAKKKRRPFLIFNTAFGIQKQYEYNITWTKKIKNALKEDRIITHYQPIVNNETMEIEKYESLVRLVDEDGKIITPNYFLDVAKKARIYPEITRKVINKVFKKFRNRPYGFSINLSVSDIMNMETVYYLIEKLKNFPNPQNVVFEILESEGIENFEEVSRFIKEVKSYGAKIAIDDFGTGYSNFEFVLKLDVDYIKIDSSLIQNLDKDIYSTIIVETIVGFSKKLGIYTIAEFVHSEEIFKQVKDLGIDYSQGFYLGEPKAEIM